MIYYLYLYLPYICNANSPILMEVRWQFYYYSHYIPKDARVIVTGSIPLPQQRYLVGRSAQAICSWDRRAGAGGGLRRAEQSWRTCWLAEKAVELDEGKGEDSGGEGEEGSEAH